MKVILSPADVTILQAAKETLYAVYTAQMVMNNIVIDPDDLSKAQKTIEAVINGLEVIKEVN